MATATIEFNDYIVDSFSYTENEVFKNPDDNRMDVNLDFSAKVAYKDTLGIVILDASVGELDNEHCPFLVNVSLKGLFSYEVDSNELELKELMTSNAIAILYPYLRSVISSITTLGNQFPTFVLPVINVVEMMKENDSIEIIDLDELD